MMSNPDVRSNSGASGSGGERPGALEAHLRRAALDSERLRAGILAAVAALGTLLAAVLLLVLDDALLLRSGGPLGSPAVWLGLTLLAYESLVRHLLGRRIEAGAPDAGVWPWVSLAAEVSAVSAALAFAFAELGPAGLTVPFWTLYFLVVALAVLGLDARAPLFAAALAAGQYVGLAALLLPDDPAPPSPETSLSFYVARTVPILLIGTGCAFVGWEIRRRVGRAWAETLKRTEVQRVFGEHTHPSVVDELLKSGGEVRGERRHVCVLFFDLRGYTGFAERRPPGDVVDFLNDLFALCLPRIHRHGGVVHQLLGDGFMAIFGAPLELGDKERRALMAAVEIREDVHRAVASGALPDVGVAIGIHAGEVVAGSVGSPFHREWKVTGDVVNTAARIEALTRELEAPILVSEAVWLAGGEGLQGRDRGVVPIRGRDRALRLIEVTSGGSAAAPAAPR